MKTRFYTAEHRGGLKECMQTERPITEEIGAKLIAIGIYEYYGYDKRIKKIRFILKEHNKNIGLPTWLHFNIEDE